jgi:serine/threonine-protein kinase RsbW
VATDHLENGTQIVSAATSDSADVELRLPADGVYASVLRTTTAALAARLDFTIDDIEDLRMAVAEAAALVLAEADPDADLTARFHLGRGTIGIEVSTEAIDDPEPDLESFAWQVLDTLATDAAITSEHGVFGVRFTMSSQFAERSAEPPSGAET